MANKIEFAHESFTQVKREIEPLLKDHWEEIAVNKDKIKLNPDWKQYGRLDAINALRVYTARSGSKLVGYFVVIVSKNMHYQDHLFASNDVIFLAKTHRKGTTGIRLIKYAEEQLKAEGVSVMVVNTKTHQPFDVILERQGFELTERVYTKCFLRE